MIRLKHEARFSAEREKSRRRASWRRMSPRLHRVTRRLHPENRPGAPNRLNTSCRVHAINAFKARYCHSVLPTVPVPNKPIPLLTIKETYSIPSILFTAKPFKFSSRSSRQNGREIDILPRKKKRIGRSIYEIFRNYSTQSITIIAIPWNLITISPDFFYSPEYSIFFITDFLDEYYL